MRVSITVDENNVSRSNERIMHINQFLSRNLHSDESIIKVERNPVKKGQMSSGFIAGLTAIIESVNAPLVELVKCLQEYVKLYKSEIKLTNENGKTLEINSKYLSADDFDKLVNSFLNDSGKNNEEDQ